MRSATRLGVAAVVAVGITLAALAWLSSGMSDTTDGGEAALTAPHAPAATDEPPAEPSGESDPHDSGSMPASDVVGDVSGEESLPGIVIKVVDATGTIVPEAVVELRRPAECWAAPPFQRVLTRADGTCGIGADRNAFVVAHKEDVGLSEEVDLGGVDPASSPALAVRLQPNCFATILTPDIPPADQQWLSTVCESIEYGVTHGVRCTGSSPLAGHWHARPRAPFDGIVLASRGACPLAGAMLTARAGVLVVCEAPRFEGFGFVSRAQQLADDSVPALRLRTRHESGDRTERTQTHPLELVQGLEQPGRHIVAADAEGCLISPRGEVVVSEDCPVGYVELFLGPAAPILGRVLRPSGKPVEGAIVSAQVALERPTDDLWEDLTSRGVRSDAEGRFSFACVDSSERFAVRIRSFEDGSEQAFVFGNIAPESALRDYILTDDALCSRSTIAGRVIDATTGFPIPRFATRHAEARSGWSLHDGRLLGMPRDWTSASGQFEFAVRDPDERYLLQVLNEEYQPGPEHSVVVGPISPGRGGCELDIVLGAGGSIEVQVVDDLGRPASGARTYLRDARPRELLHTVHPLREGRSDRDGVLSWSKLGVGWYWALAMTDSGEWGGSLVSVAAGEKSIARVVVSKRQTVGMLRVACPAQAVTSDPTRLELRRCGNHPAWKQAESTRWVPWQPDGSGFVVVSELLTDEYEVRLWHDDGIEASGLTVVLPGEPTTLHLEMKRR